MKNTRHPKIQAVVISLILVFLLALTGCGSQSSSPAAVGEITLGASLPLTGNMAGAGGPLKLGYQAAVDKINNAGGLDVGGKKMQVKLVVLDNESDSQKASQQATTLVLQDKAAALLGPATPPLTIPVAQVAESRKIPMIATITPIRSFLASAPQGGWKYSWVSYFDENETSQLQMKTMDQVESNKKIALFTDQADDGIVQGKMWEEIAPKMGYQIVYHAQFPVGTKDFGDFIRRAQSSGADILIGQMIPPDGISLWNQMKSLNWKPKMAFVLKASTSSVWWDALKTDAEGSSVDQTWTRTGGYPQTDEAIKLFADKTPTDVELGAAVQGYSITMIMMDAIKTAGSLEPSAINDALGKVKGDYMMGKVEFKDHVSPLNAVESQWHDGNLYQVYPPVNSYKMIYPMPKW